LWNTLAVIPSQNNVFFLIYYFFFSTNVPPKKLCSKKVCPPAARCAYSPQRSFDFNLTALTGWLSFQTGRQTINDLVAQLLGEATSRIWDRLDNYLKEGVGKGEGTYNQIPTVR
jgi:hypothetical protein